jgi:hypothetical protein
LDAGEVDVLESGDAPRAVALDGEPLAVVVGGDRDEAEIGWGVAGREIEDFAVGARVEGGDEDVWRGSMNQRFAVEGPKRIERFSKCQFPVPTAFPFCRARFSSFRIKAVLCLTSCARSLVDADDRLPTSVLEKRGSGLKR